MAKKYQFVPKDHLIELKPLLYQLDRSKKVNSEKFYQITKKYPKKAGGFFSKSEILQSWKQLEKELSLQTPFSQIARKLKKKPTRTISGVVPVTVLTKPFPCPGKCIFCPNDVKMPKSYLSMEPGAQRATANNFDPYLQSYNRLKAYQDIGHLTDKVELIVLGGTWSFYPEDYQIWFIKRCFEAINDFGEGQDKRDQVKPSSDFTYLKTQIQGSKITKTYNQIISQELTSQNQGKLLSGWEKATWKELFTVQQKNTSSKCKNVGLVLETRPDNISTQEIIRLRKLGCTKTQIGIQSLSDKVLTANKRGHNVSATKRAFRLLRLAGFKIHAHWMANLYTATPESDIRDYQKLFSDPAFRPDELKIYPTSLINSAELMQYYQKGLWYPYTHDELLKVVSSCLIQTPEYCRLTRVIRDIPSQDIVVGNKKTNFRQITEQEINKQKIQLQEIRSREIRSTKFDPTKAKLRITTYQTTVSTEKFLQFVTPKNQIIGFLRLSLLVPTHPSYFKSHLLRDCQANSLVLPESGVTNSDQPHPFIQELKNSAIIREIHVYGAVSKIGKKSTKKAQHHGFGTKLLEKAKQIAKKNGYKNLAVISAIGTREYYQKRGFTQGKLYQHLEL